MRRAKYARLYTDEAGECRADQSGPPLGKNTTTLGGFVIHSLTEWR